MQLTDWLLDEMTLHAAHLSEPKSLYICQKLFLKTLSSEMDPVKIRLIR
jgi:hypothetical protein